MDDKPSLPEKIYDELLAGNPLIIVAILFVLVALGSWWVWQGVLNPVVDDVPTPRNRHPNIKTLPVNNPNLLESSPTPAPTTSSRLPGGEATPVKVAFSRKKMAAPEPMAKLCSLALLASGPMKTHPFSR